VEDVEWYYKRKCGMKDAESPEQWVVGAVRNFPKLILSPFISKRHVGKIFCTTVIVMVLEGT
jgi:hypothetical protein